MRDELRIWCFERGKSTIKFDQDARVGWRRQLPAARADLSPCHRGLAPECLHSDGAIGGNAGMPQSSIHEPRIHHKRQGCPMIAINCSIFL